MENYFYDTHNNCVSEGEKEIKKERKHKIMYRCGQEEEEFQWIYDVIWRVNAWEQQLEFINTTFLSIDYNNNKIICDMKCAAINSPDLPTPPSPSMTILQTRSPRFVCGLFEFNDEAIMSLFPFLFEPLLLPFKFFRFFAFFLLFALNTSPAIPLFTHNQKSHKTKYYLQVFLYQL